MIAEPRTVLIVGGGPSGLFAAEKLSAAGLQIILADRMPSLGRKFLVAGRGGLNLTHSEPVEHFSRRYGTTPKIDSVLKEQDATQSPGSPHFWAELIQDFPPAALRDWAHGLGVDTFIGTSGRVFPESKQAAPLLRRWLTRLRQQGVQFRTRHEFLKWETTELNGRRVLSVHFTTPDGIAIVECNALVLAMGGASWSKTGSNGAWASSLADKIQLQPFAPFNCGYEYVWDSGFAEKYGGTPLKNIAVQVGNHRVLGELMMTGYGWEGGALYQLGADLQLLHAQGQPMELQIDLKPTFTVQELLKKLSTGSSKALELQEHKEIKEILISRVRKPWRLGELGEQLLRLNSSDFLSAKELAHLCKALRFTLVRPRSIDEAISSSGGVLWSELTAGLQITKHSGVFCIGEMIDWDAPTGGFLLQGCFATAFRAAVGVNNYLSGKRS